MFLPFLFPDLASFERTPGLITHLRSLDSSYRAACTDAQLALLPPPMAITIYFITTSLPDRLASVRDTLLLKHPSKLTIEVLESALKDVERNLRSVASTSGAVPPPLFHRCTVPQLPTFTASLATAATDVTAAAVTTSSRSRGRSGRRGSQSAGGGGGSSGGDVASGGGGSAGAGGAPRAATGESPAAVGGGDARVHQPPTGPPAAGGGAAACPAPDWLPLVQTYGPALWGMSASQLVDLFGTSQLVDLSSASESVYSSVVSLGASLFEVPAASVRTCVDTSPGAAPKDASLSFILDSGASHYFFRDRTTLTPLPTPVSVAVADPTSGPVTARYTTTLPCPAVPSGSLTSFHVPSFSRNLVGVRPLVLVSGPVVASCSCPPHPSISRLRATSIRASRVGCASPLTPPPFVRPLSPSRLSTWASRAPPRALALSEGGFFLVVVDDYSRYTTVFPLAKKSDVTSTLIRWLLTTADTRGRRVSCLHSDHGGDFFSGILAEFCREQGIRQSWTLPESPQQNGVAERRIGLVMEIARTSMTHARAPYFLWPYTVRYAAHQPNLWPRVSQPEVSPTSLWTGSPGVASRFRVWGCLALVRDTSADKILPRAVSCVFLGFPENSADYTFYPPPLHQFFDSRGVRFDEFVPYYPPPPSLALSGVSHATPPPSIAPKVQLPSPQSSSQPTADPARAGFCGEDPGGASSRGAGVGAESVTVRGLGFGGAGVGAEPVTAGDSSLRGAGVSGAVPGSATTGGAIGSLESGPGATTAPETTPPPHPYPTRHQAHVRRAREEQLQLEREERELERQQLKLQWLEEQQQQQTRSRSRSSRSSSSHLLLVSLVFGPLFSPLLLLPPPPLLLSLVLHFLLLTPPQLFSLLLCPRCPLLFLTLGLRVALLVLVPCPLFPSLTFVLPFTEFASIRCLDYATSLVAAAPTSPLAVGGECALGCDALEDRQFELEFLVAASPHLCAMLLAPDGDPDALDIPTPRTYAEAVSGPWASQWRAAMDSEMASYRSTGIYVVKVPPLGANVVNGMWIFRVKRPPGSPPPSSADPSLFVRRGSTPLFVLVYVDDVVFATADRVALAEKKLELQKRHTCTDLGELRHYLGLQITKERAARTITLSQSHMVQQVLQRFELQHSSVQRTPLAIDHRLTGPFRDEPFEPSGPYADLVGCLMYLMTCTRPDLAFPLSILARFVAPGRHHPVHWTAAVRVAKYLATTSGVRPELCFFVTGL
ncbi:unnamed protein product, partial [Closterium sp. NIES-54]